MPEPTTDDAPAAADPAAFVPSPRRRLAFAALGLALFTSPVLAIVALLGVMHIPSSAESRAGAMLRLVHRAQEAARALRLSDADGDGVPEYVPLSVLATARHPDPPGAEAHRGFPRRGPPILERPFEVVLRDGTARAGGYLFWIELPERDGAEGQRAVDVDGAERTWRAVARPIGNTKGAELEVDASGRVRRTDQGSTL